MRGDPVLTRSIRGEHPRGLGMQYSPAGGRQLRDDRLVDDGMHERQLRARGKQIRGVEAVHSNHGLLPFEPGQTGRAAQRRSRTEYRQGLSESVAVGAQTG